MSNSEQNQQIQNYLSQGIEHVDETTYVITHQVESSGQPLIRSLDQVEQLRMIIRQMEQERNHIVESEVLKALKSQEEQFNIFYQENIRKVELHYETEVIPQRIKLVENQFYKHQPLSTLTQVTSSSTTLIPTDIQRTQKDLNQQAYLSEKYEQWKVTYLPVILELREREWRERYEAVELEKILKKKFQEWESIRLLSIMREHKNKWILEDLFAQRYTELNRNFQLTLNFKIHEVQQYWQQALNQRISSELAQWNANQQALVKAKIHEVEQYWQQVILPQRITLWSQKHGSSLEQSSGMKLKSSSTTLTYTSADLDHILAQQQVKWQSQTQALFLTRLQTQQQNWQLIVLPHLKQQLQKQYISSHQVTTTTQLDTSRIDQIINAKYQEWKHTYLPEYLRLEKVRWLEEFTKNELEVVIRRKQEEWESLRLLAIVREKRNQWVIEALLKDRMAQIQSLIINQERAKWQIILQQKTKQWELRIQALRKQWQSEWQSQRSVWLSTILIQKQSQWQSQYLQSHPQQQVINQVDIQSQLINHQKAWRQEHQKILKAQLQQVEKYWSGIIEQQRLSFEKTIQSALQVRTTEIQTYWQTVMLPQIKSQWEEENPRQLKSHSMGESQEDINRRVHVVLQLEIQKRMEEWLRVELPLIVQKNRQEWYVSFVKTQEFTAVLMRERQEWVRAVESDYHKQLNEQRVYFEGEIQRVRALYGATVTELERNLTVRQSEYRTLQTKIVTLQKSLIQPEQVKQSLITQQVIQKVKIDHQTLIHQLKLSYQQKLSQLNHQKSILQIQLKQVQITLHNAQTAQTRPNKQSLNFNVIQANFDKQIMSLEASIKTKESQNSFLKKSIDAATLENQQLNQRIIGMNGKVGNLETLLDEARNNSIKLDYEIKYLKEKEGSFAKKLQNKDFQFNQLKSRLQFEKSLVQKKLREHSSSTQTVSTLQLKINQYESQLSLKHSSLKTLQNELDRKKRQLEQEKQRSSGYLREIEVEKCSFKQYESVIQDLRLEIRKSCDQINRQKLLIETGEQKERSFVEQIKKLQSRAKSFSQSEELIRENERLKFELTKMRQRLASIQSKQSMQIYRLKQTILSLQTRLNSTTMSFRQGDITQIEILKRINHEISQLVSSNKQLQMRIIVLENEKELSAFGISIERFFVAFQEQMDHLVNYFVNGQMWPTDSIGTYNKFQHKSRETLTHGYVEDYFRQWQALMRGLIEQNYQRYANARKIERRGEAISVKDEEIDEIVDKYDAVLNDVKFTLLEFIKTGEEEYIQLMSKSLGLEVEGSGVVGKENNGIVKK